MTTVLLVDDEPGVLFTIEEALAGRGYDLRTARSGEEALSIADEADIVVTDLVMPGMDGLALLAALRSRAPERPVILLTARGSERVAVEAMKAGAYHYVAKPFDVDELRVVVARAAELDGLRRSVRDAAIERVTGRPIVGRSESFRRVVEQARRIADKNVPVLVRGETGTGKELVAALLHAASPRATAPLVRFNCAAIPAELAEAELFGHARGAFTGAHTARDGFFVQADRGTLVLDEVGELPLAVQAKLLRVVQEGEVQPVGGRLRKVDVRIVSCTHRDLLAESRAGRFREDLYYRLAVVELVIPPLRERREDIPLLVESFRSRYAQRFGLGDVAFDPALVAALASRDWPGNVRELENAVARILALSPTEGTIGLEGIAQLEGGSPERETSQSPAASRPLREQVGEFERGILQTTLAATGGNQSEAARRLGITRVTLIDKMKRYGLGTYGPTRD